MDGQAEQTDALGRRRLAADDPRHSYIHAAILFADIENSVMLSSTLRPLEYDGLLMEFQQAMQGLVDDLRAEGYPIGEVSIAGDQLSIFFYDPAEEERNRLLDGPEPVEGEARQAVIVQCRATNDDLVFKALMAAIEVKNRWLLQEFNLERVRHRREALGVGIGFHIGQVYYRDRPDGRKRIEGFAVNLAKRVEGFARLGDYSKIMLSQAAHDRLQGMRRRHTQVRQRVFFKQHEVSLELLKGVVETQEVFELKFFSRIAREAPADVIRQYELMFYLNPRNIWAYYQLFEHYAYVAGDWDKVLSLIKLAMVSHPQDEKILLDLARYYFRQKDYRLAKQLVQQALDSNPEFDLAHELLSQIASEQELYEEVCYYMGRAVALAPGSPINHYNFAIALCDVGDKTAAEHHFREAFRMYPEYLANSATLNLLTEMYSEGSLPENIGRMLPSTNL
jgi:class 3 adenylate cyclase